MEEIIAIAKAAENRKEEIERIKDIPTDIIERVKQAGLVRMWAAKEYEGRQYSVSKAMVNLQKIAYYNGSLAWVTSVTNCASLISGFLPREMAQLIFGRRDAMVGGFAGPAGVAEEEVGGLRVSGQWSWGSGIRHCTHIVGGVKLFKQSQRKGIGLVFFESSEIVIEDNWEVVGLKGTNSINYSAENVFIPNERWIIFPPQEALIDDPLYRFSFLGALSLSVAAVGLGLAERALEEVKNILRGKSPMGSKRTLAQAPITQQIVGQIHGEYLAAKSLFYQTIQTTEASAKLHSCSKDEKAAIRLAACHTTTLAIKVVREAYQLAGGSAIWKSGKLEEIHRDIHVLSQHAMVTSVNYRTAGAVLLDNEVPTALL